MSFLRKPDLGGAFGDLRAFFRTVGLHHYIAGLAAIAVTGFLVWGFYREGFVRVDPQIVYVESWPANRTDAEIQADQKKDAAERHAAEAERRADFQKIEKFNEKIGL